MVIFLEPMRFGPQNFGSPASQIYPPFDWHHFRNISWWVEYRPLKWSSIGFSIGPTGNPCRRDLLTPFSVDFSTTRAPTKLPSELMAINKRDLSIDTNFEQFCENGIDPIVENRAGERWTGCRPLHAQSIHYTRSTPPRVWRFSATRIHSLFDFVSSSWTKVGYMRRAGARATVQGCKTMCPQDLEDTPSCWRVLLISYFSPS